MKALCRSDDMLFFMVLALICFSHIILLSKCTSRLDDKNIYISNWFLVENCTDRWLNLRIFIAPFSGSVSLMASLKRIISATY